MTSARLAPAPARRFAVVCFGLEHDRVRRQPWHVAGGIAQGLRRLGHEVLVVTDALDPPAMHGGALVTAVPDLLARGRPTPALRTVVAKFAPERVFLIAGGFALARLRRLDLGMPVSIVMASPRLGWAEVARLGVRTLWRERRFLALPLVNALLPALSLRMGLARSRADEIVYLSRATQARYGRLGLPHGRLLVPQLDPAQVVRTPPPKGEPVVGYLGPPLDLRGAGLAVDAFEAAQHLGLGGRLLLLLRPDGGRAALDRLLARIERSPVRERIAVETRMLTPAELHERLARCRVFLFPFLAPVSEVPLVVLEAGLAGRPVVVLDAPGVTEYAEAMGGVVAPSPADLPHALLRAARQPLGPPPDPTPWTRWDRAVATLVGDEPADARCRSLSKLRLVALCGVDGSGKTLLADRLAERLRTRNIPHRRVWSRFRNYLSKPLLALARFTGHNRKEVVDGVRVGYHDFQDSRALALAFLALQWLDGALDILLRWRLGRRRLLVADRCALDTLVDLAVDTGRDELVFGAYGRSLVALLPRPRLAVVLSRNTKLIREQRPDALADRHFAKRRALYQRLAQSFGLPVVENDGPPEAIVEAILRLADDVPAEGAEGKTGR